MKKFMFTKTESWPLNRWKMTVESDKIDELTDKLVSNLVSVGTFINNCFDNGVEKEFGVSYNSRKYYILKSYSKQDVIFPEDLKKKKFGFIFEHLFKSKFKLEYFYIKSKKSEIIVSCIFSNRYNKSRIYLKFCITQRDGEITEGWSMFIKSIFDLNIVDNKFQNKENKHILTDVCPCIEIMKSEKFERMLIELV